MTTKRLVKIVLLMAIAISVTMLVNMRFPKYGNTEEDIAHLVSRNPWYITLISGSDVETVAVFDLGIERVAIVKPIDEAEQQFAMVRFKKNQSDKYELREDGILWCPNDQMKTCRVEFDGKNYDICAFNRDDVVLLQRLDVSLLVQNYTVDRTQKIVAWEAGPYRYTYNVLTTSGMKVNEKK